MIQYLYYNSLYGGIVQYNGSNISKIIPICSIYIAGYLLIFYTVYMFNLEKILQKVVYLMRKSSFCIGFALALHRDSVRGIYHLQYEQVSLITSRDPQFFIQVSYFK